MDIISEISPEFDAPIGDSQPVVGSDADLAMPAPGQTCCDCGRAGHRLCG